MVDVIAWALVIVPAIPALAAWILVRHLRSDSPSLAERALVAIRDWLVASLVAIVALNRIFEWHLPSLVVVLLLGGGMLLVSLPSAWWLYMYQRGAFR